MKDKKDDKLIGVKSTALTWSDQTKTILKRLNVVTVSGLAISGYFSGLNLYLYFPILGICWNYLHSIVAKIDIDDPASCNKGFIDNKWFGILIFGGILFGKIY